MPPSFGGEKTNNRGKQQRFGLSHSLPGPFCLGGGGPFFVWGGGDVLEAAKKRGELPLFSPLCSDLDNSSDPQLFSGADSFPPFFGWLPHQKMDFFKPQKTGFPFSSRVTEQQFGPCGPAPWVRSFRRPGLGSSSRAPGRRARLFEASEEPFTVRRLRHSPDHELDQAHFFWDRGEVSLGFRV